MNSNDLTHEDIKNVLHLIGRVENLKGTEAFAVAVIQQKLTSILPKEEVKPEEVPEEKLAEVIGKDTE